MFTKKSMIRVTGLVALACFALVSAGIEAVAQSPSDSFALQAGKPEVKVVPLSEADQEGIARQKVCPVMGTKLDDHGQPVKVLIGQQPVYLCCKGCLGRVKANPEHYAEKAAELSGQK